MKATEALHDQGQSLWLDNITRDLLESGTLARYIDELSVTGLTSNPTIFDHAIKNSSAYDAAIRKKVREGKSGEELFFDLALEDITRAADLFRPINDRTAGVDGWVSLEVSPLLAHDTASSLAAAKELFTRAGRRNLFIKIPGTTEGVPAIEEAIFAGAPVTVNTMPKATLKALAEHGEVGALLPADGGDCEEVLAWFGEAGINVDALAVRLQDEGAKSFVKSWDDLLGVITSKSAMLAKA